MKPLERTIQSAIQLALGGKPDCRMFRNQVGLAYVGEYPNQRRITTGLATGSGDLIGWRTYKITPDDVGKNIAVFTSVEVKRPGIKATEHQHNWANVVSRSGGIGVIVSSPQLAETAVFTWKP